MVVISSFIFLLDIPPFCEDFFSILTLPGPRKLGRAIRAGRRYYRELVVEFRRGVGRVLEKYAMWVSKRVPHRACLVYVITGSPHHRGSFYIGSL